MNDTQSSINNIVGEIRGISTLFNLPTNNADVDADVEADGEGDDFMKDGQADDTYNDDDDKESVPVNIDHIQSCKSVEEYINSACSLAAARGRPKDKVDDYQLLSLVNQTVQRSELGYDVTQPVQAMFYDDRLVSAKKQLQSSYSLVDPMKGINGKEIVFCVGHTTGLFYLPWSDKTQEVEGGNQLCKVYTVPVFAKGHLYLFGTYYGYGGVARHNKSFARYSFETQQWTNHIISNRIDIIGDSNLTACFDGYTYIYLVGKGAQQYSDGSVVRLNVQTLEFALVGNPNFGQLFPRALYFFNNHIYGTNHQNIQVQAISCYNGHVSTVFNDVGHQPKSSSYDDNGKIYFYTDLSLIEVSLATMTKQTYLRDNPPVLDKMLYFNNPNYVLLNGQWIQCKEDVRLGSCVFRHD
ncbi:hypothetical protein SAMD00019534_023210 [Acytostelium subglobosum LB1]|uniref:hypothetical protein n=1 Tax=Acytostelium subglobosum LB1 TaxID=1410327 RepID=UPI000644B9C6|nr:hypothetical protein SAMD00019534_023210 [Acytostelium subglobosum LB1]GAM19146.1 hypothetical protein SAMD00019534_023210 [Acytostelium subglobosum LB1]|eukprot:XP_012757073.1 hypothetical protein SAMD00019534_023210 [Acytostelium subglobosum LB1]